MALRPLSAGGLTRRRGRGNTDARPRAPVAVVPVPAPTSDLRFARAWLFAAVLAGPLVLALGGFIGSGVRGPSWPELLAETPVRGSLVAADGTVLAEGPAEGRSYPQGTLAAQLLGFSGSEQPDGRYGLEGLERELDADLQAGQNVTLTLDPALQSISQTELARAARLHGATNGVMVMLEARTGRVLASASYPEFDPNTQSALENRSAIRNDPFLAAVEPGSIMKPLVVAALLEEYKLFPNEVLAVEPTRRVGDKTFADVSAHEPRLAVRDILRYSSNVGMIELGERLTSPELAAWFGRYGFGESLGTQAAPNAPGIVNPPETWVPQDHASATIGQSMAATALQLAAAYNVIAGNGRYVTPQVLEAAVGTGPARQVLRPEVAETVRGMLAYTVENSGLRDAKIPGVTVAGKSGSADLYDTERGEYIDAGTLSFAGMFPAENPRVVGVMYLQRVKEKGALSVSVTAPAFRAVGSQAVALWDEAELAGRAAPQADTGGE